MMKWLFGLGAYRASSGRKILATLVLGPALALQGCAKKEEPQPAVATVAQQVLATDDLETQRTPEGAEYVPGQLLVRFKKGAGALALAAHKSAGAKVLHTYRTRPELQLVSVDAAAMQSAIAAYQQDPGVESVELNHVYRISSTTPNDGLFQELWGLHNIGQQGGVPDTDINAPEAWDLTTGGSAAGVIAVIDSGIDYTHQDLVDNLWTNEGELPDNGIDDDDNGYVDDIHGINAITGTGDPMDDNGHGTHVSGTIAARGNNTLGVTGVSWAAQLMSCKFLTAAGTGTAANAVKCLDYVHLMKRRSTNSANVIATNNSWSGTFTQAVLDAIVTQRDDGTLFIAAAGNTGANGDTTANYPSAYAVSNVIAVTAHDRVGSLPGTSGYGRRTVDIMAPGVGVQSTVPGGDYDTMDGTSMAAPHVSGVVALLKAQDPSRDWRRLKNLVLAGGVDAAAAQGKTLTGKRLRAADTGGMGSLTCNNRPFTARVAPVADTVSVNVFEPVQLVVYNINCDQPAGPPVVTLSNGESLTLADGGRDGDEAAGDGMYTGAWEPSFAGVYTLTFPGGDTLTVNVGGPYQKSLVPIAWRTFTGTSLAQTDSTVSTITSPFPIPFANGPGLTSVRVAMNGGITFDSTTSLTATNATLPYTTRTTLIAPFWDDLYPGPTAADNVFWGVLGTAPNRELVVEWRNVHHSSTRTGTDTVLFQVVFLENSSDILVNYKDVVVGNATYDRGAAATVGVQTNKTAYALHSFNTAALQNDTAILWRMPLPGQSPVVGNITLTPANVTEGDTVTVSAAFTDPDGDADGPFKVEFDLDYPGWFTSDTNQSVPAQGSASASRAMLASGAVKVAVRVEDKGRTRSGVAVTTINVQDVAPLVAPVITADPPRERQSIAFSTSFTDPGLDSPWRVEWDFDYDGSTFTVDAYSTAAAPGSASVIHKYLNDGNFTVAVRVVDKEGVVSNLQTMPMAIADVAPLLTGIAGTTSLREGSTYQLLSLFSNPGDNSRPWKVQWDFNYDGVTFNVHEEEVRTLDGVISLERAARDAGPNRYALRVVDGDGSISLVQTLLLDVEEAEPILGPLNAQLLAGNGGEPTEVTFDVSAISGAEDPTADPIRAFLWDFDGDGRFDSSGTSPVAVYSYRDNPAGGGAYTARVRVVDEDSYSEETVQVAITNVAPTLSAPASVDVTEGHLLALRLSATDPGDDTLTFSISNAPQGLNLTSEGLLLWTPALGQTSGTGRQHVISVTVTDDDGGSDTKSIALVARWRDADGDGMADTWEQEHGLNPTVADAAGDIDGDGVSNLSEFLSEHGGPRLPQAAVADGPSSGARVDAAQVVLSARNVADAGDLASVKYQFQVFADLGLATQVRDVTVDQAATGTVTQATVPDGTESPGLVDLNDDQVYAWRVRATDGTMHGPWSEVRRFVFNPANDAPSGPAGSQPMSGTQVSTDRPVLVVDNALDVDDTDLTYTFELAENSALTVGRMASAAIPGGAKGSTAWGVPSALRPFTTYYWRATARDPRGATAQSEVSSFTIYIGRPSNREPGMPALSSPAVRGTVATLTPEFVVEAATDADGDTLTYVLEVDAEFSFNSPDRQVSAALQVGTDGKVRWQPTALKENQKYYWRVRAMDPYSASDWKVGSFTVNAQNDPPSAPVALNPSDAILYNRNPAFIIQNSTDPEGDAITYTFEVRTVDGEAVASGEAPAGASGFTSLSASRELELGAEYVWSARAKDALGAVSAASADARFQIYKAPEPPKDEGCSSGAGAPGGLLALLAVGLGLRRRRQR